MNPLRRAPALLLGLTAALLFGASIGSHAATVRAVARSAPYPDGRPTALFRLDAANCRWSRHIIGLPSVVPVGRRLAVFYDGNAAEPMPAGVKSHMNRDVGLAWLDLPLAAPAADATSARESSHRDKIR